LGTSCTAWTPPAISSDPARPRPPSKTTWLGSPAPAQTTEHRRPILRGDPWVTARGGLRPSMARVAAVGFLWPASPCRHAAPQRHASATRAMRAGELDGAARNVLPTGARAGEQDHRAAVVPSGRRPSHRRWGGCVDLTREGRTGGTGGAGRRGRGWETRGGGVRACGRWPVAGGRRREQRLRASV
jgi:hypothetical protein